MSASDTASLRRDAVDGDDPALDSLVRDARTEETPDPFIHCSLLPPFYLVGRGAVGRSRLSGWHAIAMTDMCITMAFSFCFCEN